MLACSRGGGGVSVKTCVLYTSQLRGHAAQGGEAAMWPPGSPTQSLDGCGQDPGWMRMEAWVDADGGLGGYEWGLGRWIWMGAWEDADGAWEDADGGLGGCGWALGWLWTGAWLL